jgi:hypothetical protein
MSMLARKTAATEVTITGNIKSIEDYTEIKTLVTEMLKAGVASIDFKIVDSFSMPSSVIGYLIKLIHKDAIRVSVLSGDDRLLELLGELCLTETFRARKLQ